MSRRQRRRREFHSRAAAEINALTVGFTVLAGLAVLSAAVPGVEQAINTALAAAAALGVLAGVVRAVARWVRERAEDRADAADAAQVRAAHLDDGTIAGPGAASHVRVGGGGRR